jgi:halocyanin-like protein
MTDTGEITVLVGAGESGYLFDPVAVAVAPGTTITWEWTGDGGSHNVAERDEEWANPGGTLSTEGHTWSREFSSGGTELYECWPHSSLGMRGGIFIDENPDSGPEYGINETESDTQNQTEGNETPGDSNASGNETPSENQTADENRS